MALLEPHPTPSCHVVAVPYPGHGHINPMLSLCTAVAERSSDVIITVVSTEEWLGLLGSVEKPPNISFVSIPNVVPSEKVRGDDIRAFVAVVLTEMEAPFEQLLDGGALPPPEFIIRDALLPWAERAADRRNIPSAHLWTMSASVYSVFYHFDLLAQNGHFPVDLSVNGEAMVDYIPGLPPTRVADLPLVIRDQAFMPKFMQIIPNASTSKHSIFTTFYALEAEVLDALKKNSSISVYCIAPATVYSKLRDIKTSSSSKSTATDAAYLRWLDLQPPSSVLYVSLGSYLYVSMAQMDEIAAGLKESGARFLWVARRHSSRLNETSGDNGLVVEWCDQLRVLSHPSIGGFFSHCGWNSTTEAVLTGVPVLTFPLIMDQLPDAKAIVEDWRIGWRVIERESDADNLKRRDEIAEIVMRFMDLESDRSWIAEVNKQEQVCKEYKGQRHEGITWFDLSGRSTSTGRSDYCFIAIVF